MAPSAPLVHRARLGDLNLPEQGRGLAETVVSEVMLDLGLPRVRAPKGDGLTGLRQHGVNDVAGELVDLGGQLNVLLIQIGKGAHLLYLWNLSTPRCSSSIDCVGYFIW